MRTPRAFDRCAICDTWRFWHGKLHPRDHFVEPFPGSHVSRTWRRNTAAAASRAIRRGPAI